MSNDAGFLIWQKSLIEKKIRDRNSRQYPNDRIPQKIIQNTLKQKQEERKKDHCLHSPPKYEILLKSQCVFFATFVLHIYICATNVYTYLTFFTILYHKHFSSDHFNGCLIFHWMAISLFPVMNITRRNIILAALKNLINIKCGNVKEQSIFIH